MSTILRKLQREVFVLNLKQTLDKVPELAGFEATLVEGRELEVALDRKDDLNTLFNVLDDHGITVTSLRNKANRLEELFMRLVESRQQSLAGQGD